MSNCVFGFPFWSDTNTIYAPTFSTTGTAWTLPLSNTLDRRLHKVARSASAAESNTQFTLDLQRAARVGVLGVYGHNISTAGTCRWRGMSAPLAFDSRTVGDAAWTATGTPTRTAGAFTCSDGVLLDLIGDDSAAAVEYFTRPITFTGNAVKAVRFRIAKSSSYAFHRIDINDLTAPANRLQCNVDFTAATPVVTIVGEIGSIVSVTARGDGSWDVLCLTSSVTAANSHIVSVYPSPNAVADTASTYIGDVMAWDTAAPVAFASLTVGDAAWTAVGTPTRTAAAFTCSDGVTLDLVGDDSAAASEYYYRSTTLTGNGQKALRLRVKRSSAYGFHEISLHDTIASAYRLRVLLDFTTTTLAITPNGAGTVVSSSLRADGAWEVILLTDSVIAANVHNFAVIPCGGGASDTATFYVGYIGMWDATSPTDVLLYDSGSKDVWPVVYPAGSLPVGDPRLVASGGTGKYTAEEAADFAGIPFTVVPSTVQNARYWKCTIADSANVAGYIDLGRVVLAGAIQPTVNMSTGAMLGLDTDTIRTVTEGGAALYVERAVRRDAVFTIEQLTPDEAHVQFWDMQRRLGTSGQLVFVWNAADTYHMHRRAMLCVMQKLSKLAYPWGTYTSVPFQLIEEL